MPKKSKAKKVIKNVASLFSMSGKKGRRIKSLFIVGVNSNLYPAYRPLKRKSKRKRSLY
jgi:hypothetical protein